MVEHYAARFGVRSALVYGMIRQESNFDPNAVSHCGARGLMQLLPSTAGDMGVTELFDPEQNIFAGTQYISRMLKMFNGDERIALAAYNAGPGNVRKWQKRGHEIPPFKETQHYVPIVLKYARQYAANPPAEIRLASTPRKARGVLPEAGMPTFTLKFKNGYTQPAEVIVQDAEWYYIQIGDVEGRVRRDWVAEIVGPV